PPCSVVAPADPLAPHSDPTRRSSDLARDRPPPPIRAAPPRAPPAPRARPAPAPAAATTAGRRAPRGSGRRRCAARSAAPAPAPRSEEHTSELQSREKLVCRPLLEKKR